MIEIKKNYIYNIFGEKNGRNWFKKDFKNSKEFKMANCININFGYGITDTTTHII